MLTVMTCEKATKNHPGRESSKPSAEKKRKQKNRPYSTGAQSELSARLKLYVPRLNPSCKVGIFLVYLAKILA